MRTTVTMLAVLAVALQIAACGGSGGEAGTSAPPVAPADSSGEVPSAGAPIPGGGLTIQEAIDSPLEGPLMVKGFVVAAPGEPARLCSALAESHPPQCGDPSLVVEGLDLEALDGLERPDDPALSGTAWTDEEVSILGEVDNGIISVSGTSI